MTSRSKEQERWIPPSPDLWTPKLYVPNNNFMPRSVMIHRPPRQQLEMLNVLPSLKPYLYQFRRTHRILSVDRLLVRHLPYLGTAFDGKRELCYIPWVLDYIKQVLDDD